MTSLWLIEYESSQWCGGSSNVVVRAESADEAEEKASLHMDEAMRELFSDEYVDMVDEHGYAADDEQAYTVNGIEAFDESHDCWKYFIDPVQSQFFPLVE